MKKIILLSVSIFLFISSSLFSQIGVGLGSHGLNIRTNPEAKSGLIIRTGFGFTTDPLETFIRPEVAWIKRHHYSEKTKLYAGFGASSEMRLSAASLNYGYGLMIPVGLELFPLSDNKLSLSIETGLSYNEIGHPEAKFGSYGLIEITFYLDHHPDDY